MSYYFEMDQKKMNGEVDASIEYLEGMTAYIGAYLEKTDASGILNDGKDSVTGESRYRNGHASILGGYEYYYWLLDILKHYGFKSEEELLNVLSGKAAGISSRKEQGNFRIFVTDKKGEELFLVCEKSLLDYSCLERPESEIELFMFFSGFKNAMVRLFERLYGDEAAKEYFDEEDLYDQVYEAFDI